MSEYSRIHGDRTLASDDMCYSSHGSGQRVAVDHSTFLLTATSIDCRDHFDYKFCSLKEVDPFFISKSNVLWISTKSLFWYTLILMTHFLPLIIGEQ